MMSYICCIKFFVVVVISQVQQLILKPNNFPNHNCFKKAAVILLRLVLKQGVQGSVGLKPMACQYLQKMGVIVKLTIEIGS